MFHACIHVLASPLALSHHIYISNHLPLPLQKTNLVKRKLFCCIIELGQPGLKFPSTLKLALGLKGELWSKKGEQVQGLVA